jgi:hypothetical protein
MDLFVRRINFSFLTLGVIFAFYGSSYAENYRCMYEPAGCDQDPNCSPVVQKCNSYNGQYLCPINQTACSLSYVCPGGGSYNASIKKCQIDPTSDSSCPSSYTYNSSTGKCEASAQQNGYVCPLGSSYPCIDTGFDIYCSPYQCIDFENTSNIQDTDTTQGANDKKNDGKIDEKGQCQGTIRIFNGDDMRCRTAGLQTGGSDCCKKTKDWFGLESCSSSEQALKRLRTKIVNYKGKGQDKDYTEADANCHYIGEYCSAKLPFVGCVQKKKTYCCFHSPLARIIQEQGRVQIGKGWGSPESPDCSGFTIYEFQKLDFSKIDFSEWVNMVVGDETTDLQNGLSGQTQHMQDTIQDMYK